VTTTAGSLNSIPGALMTCNRSIGGAGYFWNQNGENCGQQGITEAYGLNNIGLLVRTCGKVVQIEPVSDPALPTWFKIDDGSGVNVKCVVPSGVTINPGWNYVGVTGISSCEKDGDDLYRLVRVREQSDIAPF
jgi:hypothetical protein